MVQRTRRDIGVIPAHRGSAVETVRRQIVALLEGKRNTADAFYTIVHAGKILVCTMASGRSITIPTNHPDGTSVVVHCVKETAESEAKVTARVFTSDAFRKSPDSLSREETIIKKGPIIFFDFAKLPSTGSNKAQIFQSPTLAQLKAIPEPLERIKIWRQWVALWWQGAVAETPPPLKTNLDKLARFVLCTLGGKTINLIPANRHAKKKVEIHPETTLEARRIKLVIPADQIQYNYLLAKAGTPNESPERDNPRTEPIAENLKSIPPAQFIEVYFST